MKLVTIRLVGHVLASSTYRSRKTYIWDPPLSSTASPPLRNPLVGPHRPPCSAARVSHEQQIRHEPNAVMPSRPVISSAVRSAFRMVSSVAAGVPWRGRRAPRGARETPPRQKPDT